MNILEETSAPRTPTRRDCLALTLSLAALPLIPVGAAAKPLRYVLTPTPIAPGIWTIYGANEPITAVNGGAIANVTIVDTTDGTVLIDAGPSHRYGEALKAMAESLTGKPVVRIYLTHYHTDHVLGATAFDSTVVSAGQHLTEDLKRYGNDLTNGMYHVAGDWMRGTGIPQPGVLAREGVEAIGQHRFRLIRLAGHTREDLCLFEERSGLLFAGDLVFLDRAATTPDANLPAWRTALTALSEIEHRSMVLGHGPVEAGRRGIDQTRRWLDMIEARIEAGFERGLDITELMGVALPGWTHGIAVARYEFARSVMHILPTLEMKKIPICSI